MPPAPVLVPPAPAPVPVGSEPLPAAPSSSGVTDPRAHSFRPPNSTNSTLAMTRLAISEARKRVTSLPGRPSRSTMPLTIEP